MLLSTDRLKWLKKLTDSPIIICPFDYPASTAQLDYLCEIGFAFKQPKIGNRADVIDDWEYRVTQAGEQYILELHI